MSVVAVVIICLVVFAYTEFAIGFGYYMYLKSRKAADNDEKQQKQNIKYSIIAGVAFPVTFAIIIANKVAERG